MTHESRNGKNRMKGKGAWGALIGAGLALLLSTSGAVGAPVDLPAGIHFEPEDALDLTSSNRTIGPGSFLAIRMAGIWNGCTANWVWKDDNGIVNEEGTVYLGTAGHCVLSEPGATHGPGGDVNAADVPVYACLNPCPVGGLAGMAASNVVASTAFTAAKADWVRLGKVAYARLGPGSWVDDFALIEVPPSVHGRVGPRMPVWGGPAGTAVAAAGDAVVTHGNGIGLGETYATKSRSGTFFATTGALLSAEIWSASGDSGAPAGILEVDETNGTSRVLAAGVLTGCQAGQNLCMSVAGVGFALPGEHVMRGPTVAYAKALAAQAGLCIGIVLENQTAVGAPRPNCPT